MLKMIRDEFGDVISHVEAARIIQEAFPQAAKKHVKGRVVYAGINLRPPSLSTTSTCTQEQSLSVQLAKEQEKSRALVIQVQQLQDELQRVQTQQSPVCTEPAAEMYTAEMTQLQHSVQLALHGPDTMERFSSFTMESVVQEISLQAPQLYQLFHRVGKSQRNRHPETEGYTVEEIKAVMSLCTLLNASTSRARGVQLLMGLGLIARGTHKQVYILPT